MTQSNLQLNKVFRAFGLLLLAFLPFSSYAAKKPNILVIWGDTHLHTANSVDAGFVGNKLGPADAFRFGVPIPKGAPVSTQERAYTSPIWYMP